MWKQWFKKFWWVHGERHVYGFYALGMSVVFVCFGKRYNIPELTSAGVTILVGLAMIFFNKVRGNGKDPIKPESEGK